MLHVDLFNNICEKSNNEKMTSPKETNVTLFLYNNDWNNTQTLIKLVKKINFTTLL